MMVERIKRICHSCCEPFFVVNDRQGDSDLTAKQLKQLKSERQIRCEDCAREKVLGTLDQTTTMYGTGGGRRVIRSTKGLS